METGLKGFEFFVFLQIVPFPHKRKFLGGLWSELGTGTDIQIIAPSLAISLFYGLASAYPASRAEKPLFILSLFFEINFILSLPSPNHSGSSVGC